MKQNNQEGSSELGQSKNRGTRSGLVWFGVLITLAMVVVAFGGAYFQVAKFTEEQERGLEHRLALFAEGRAYSVNAWIRSNLEIAGRLVDSGTFRVFASEVDQYEGDITAAFATEKPDSSSGQVASQLPYIRNLLDDFIRSNSYAAGRIMNSKAKIYISTEPLDPPNLSELEKLANKVLSSSKFSVSSIRQDKNGLAVDFLMPMFADNFEAANPKPVAVLVITHAISGKLSEWLTSSSFSTEQNVGAFLVQRTSRGFSYASDKGTLSDLQSFVINEESNNYVFGLRSDVAGLDKVYALGQSIGLKNLKEEPDWWIVVESKQSLLQAGINKTMRTSYGIAALISLVVMLMGGTAWWWLVGSEQRKMAGKFKELYEVIENQKRLLDGINASISDPIAFSDINGIYRYVNPAFARAVGREPKAVIGLDTSAVLGFDTAKRLNMADQQAKMTGETITSQEVLWLQSQRYCFQISKSPLRDESGKNILGIVAVFRDITKLVDAQDRSRRMVQQTIDALVRAIEESDPFLGGHSRLMGSVASVIARAMNLPEHDVATIEAAANLSQIGKMFVPRDILTKSGALTAEEKQKMEQHVYFAKDVLKDIEFDLPVVEAIYQMNERLDGKGYPRKLQGDKINIHARILAIANAFTAMARPRSYRPALPVEEVMTFFEKQVDSYDPAVVSILRDVLKTPTGERIVQLAAASQAN